MVDLAQLKDSPPQITADQAAKIKTMLKLKIAQHKIAACFGINQGRVSEIKTGKLFRDVQPSID